MMVTTIEEMRERKRELGYSYDKIAEMADLPVGTVQKVLGGFTKSPRYSTLKALEEVFVEKPAQTIREAQVPYPAEKKQGEFTIEDYYALPDEQRVELIDGVIYDMSPPTSIHQLVSARISNIFMNHISANKGKCIALYAPMDVQLDCDNKTMVQPDVLIVCDRDKVKNNKIYGAPDLIVEILSQSTRKKDSLLKTQKYANAGVREYWIVDPKKKRVIVYDFENDEWPILYGFEDIVPVSIFDCKCEVNFAEVYEYVSFLYN